jgi:enamine deaminase RidA (YjgF/YER057c/UK114 family)
MKKQLRTDGLSAPSGHFSQGVITPTRGRMVFISGMTARDTDGRVVGPGDIDKQTRQVCENLKQAMGAAGGTLNDIVRVDVFVRNIEHFDAIHRVRREYFSAPAPASTMLEVSKMVSPEMLIEINAIAVVDDGNAES